MNWGKGLVLALVAFASLMAWFVVKATQNPEPLVTERYYEEELLYQGRIDNTERANKLSGSVAITLDRRTVHLRFPAELAGQPITGELTLLRPNDPEGDRNIAVVADSQGAFTAAFPELPSGRYNALLTWRNGAAEYYTEEKLVVE